MFIDDQKRLLKYDEEINKWILALLKRFKEFSSIVMITIIKKRYIMNDARRKRESFKFVQMIIRAIKFIEMIIYSQIYFIYNDIKFKFRRDLTKSTKNMTMKIFLQKLKNNKKIWWNLEARHRDDYVVQFENQRFNDLNNRSDNIFRSYQSQYDSDYRSGFDVMKTESNVIEARSAYQNTSPSRNQFPTFYQFRISYQNNNVYLSQQSNRQSSSTDEAFFNFDETYFSRNQTSLFSTNCF